MSAKEAALVACLADLIGVTGNDVVMIHAAFSGLSRQGLRCEPFIEAWQSCLPEGTLMMPAMSWRLCTDAHPFFDELETGVNTGVLSDVFRRSYASHRSVHPTHSASAAGKKAQSMTAGHYLTTTPCPLESPFGRLITEKAVILLLGVGFESCTSIHVAEEIVAPDIYLKPLSESFVYHCRDRFGQQHDFKVRRHLKLERDFPKFGRALERLGRLRTGRIGDIEWMACRADHLHEVVMAALARNPRAILAGQEV